MLLAKKSKKSKKGFVEITSFALLTGLILVTSLVAYLVINDIIESKIHQLDRDNMEIHLKKIQIELNKLETFSGSSSSYAIDFKSGGLDISDNEITYKSFIEYSTTSESCFGGICYNSQNNFETITLKNNLNFSSNITLGPNTYILQFTNNGGGEIEIKFR